MWPWSRIAQLEKWLSQRNELIFTLYKRIDSSNDLIDNLEKQLKASQAEAAKWHKLLMVELKKERK